MYNLIMILAIVAIVLGAAGLAIAIWALIRAQQAFRKAEDVFGTMRERISKLVRDINNVNELEYNVDVEQQNKINALLGGGNAATAAATAAAR